MLATTDKNSLYIIEISGLAINLSDNLLGDIRLLISNPNKQRRNAPIIGPLLWGLCHNR